MSLPLSVLKNKLFSDIKDDERWIATLMEQQSSIRILHIYLIKAVLFAKYFAFKIMWALYNLIENSTVISVKKKLWYEGDRDGNLLLMFLFYSGLLVYLIFFIFSIPITYFFESTFFNSLEVFLS